MQKKRDLPDDWTKLTDEEAMQHVKYLKRHYKQYNPVKIDKNSIQMHGVMLTRKMSLMGHEYFEINGEVYIPDTEVSNAIKSLFYGHDRRLAPLKKQIKKWLRDNVIFLGASAIFVAVIAVMYFMYKQDEKQIKHKTVNDVINMPNAPVASMFSAQQHR